MLQSTGPAFARPRRLSVQHELPANSALSSPQAMYTASHWAYNSRRDWLPCPQTTSESASIHSTQKMHSKFCKYAGSFCKQVQSSRRAPSLMTKTEPDIRVAEYRADA